MTEGAQRRSPLGVVLTCVGAAFVAITLVAALLMALPGLVGWQQMMVLTGSMEPEMPVGSMVYVAPTEPKELAQGDVIAFASSDGDTVTHRVVENKSVEGQLVTKGDANAEEDVQPVRYADVIGKVVLTVPSVGELFAAMSTTLGKVYLIAFGACGVMLVILGGRLRKA